MKKRYFSYSTDNGFVLHETAEQARACAEEGLREYRDDASFDGEWPEEVDSVAWGEIKQRATEVPWGDADRPSCDFELQGVVDAAMQQGKQT